MHALDTLNDKLDTLLRKHAAIQAENKRLKATIAGQSKSLEALNSQLSTLEKGMVSVRLGNTAVNEDEKDNMRKQLDMVIADIDKLLTTLND